MSATHEQARFVFEEWHRRVEARDGAAVAELYTDDAALDHFIAEAARRRPGGGELPSLHRAGTFAFDGETLTWEYPREAPGGDKLDLVEVMELEGPRIRRHRVYWGWRGTEHLIANALARLEAGART